MSSFQLFLLFISLIWGGQLTEAFILDGLCFVGMMVLRLEYATLVSVLIGLTSLIPIVGAFIGAVPSIFILFMISPQKALVFVIFLVALQQFEGNIIYREALVTETPELYPIPVNKRIQKYKARYAA